MIRADSTRVKVMANGVVAACHVRCYDRNQLIILLAETDIEEPDPAAYDRFILDTEEPSHD